LRTSIDNLLRVFGLPTAKILDDFIQAVVTLRGVLVTDSLDFVNDFVVVHVSFRKA
jgi:hypothetical protein